ncbi:unnamed protein product [Trichobilharzia szidati]|nr:unnamed protein product [Trichobilharzia szidati]
MNYQRFFNQNSLLPSWHKYYDPIYSVTADCVLEWPDPDNCNEFPVICPVHGIWSRWCVQPDKGICTCKTDSKSDTSKDKSAGDKPDRNIQEILRKIWDGELPGYLTNLNSGGASDPVEKRHACFTGAQLRLTPRRPVIVNSHSVRALSLSKQRKPKISINRVPLTIVYAYLADMELYKEWCALFRHQLRHTFPEDLNFREVYREENIYRKQNCSGILVNVFPNKKCYVTHMDYSKFVIRPNIHYGDQILELKHCVLEEIDEPFPTTARSAQTNDVFHLRTRPCPFLKYFVINVGQCPVINELTMIREKRNAINSYYDLGLQIHNGCITAVAVNSPAKEAGLQPDQQIVEVNGHFVIDHSDIQIISLIRQILSNRKTHSVGLLVIPRRIHEHLQTVNNLHQVISNQGFHMGSWVNAVPFGLRYVDIVVFNYNLQYIPLV